MEQVANTNGHSVYVRCPTSPPSWEAACTCGFRSARYHSEGDAKDAGTAHADQAPAFKSPKKASKKTARHK